MFDIKKMKKYIESKEELVTDIDELFSMLQIPENDFNTKWQILETITNHNNLILLKKSHLAQQLAKDAEKIEQKIINNQVSTEPIIIGQISAKSQSKSKYNNDLVQMYINFINEGYNISEIIEEISGRSNAKEIIAGILLVCLEELKTWHTIAKDNEYSCSLEAKYEIDRLKEIINSIKTYKSVQEVEGVEEEYKGPNYKVTFYRSPSGNNSFFSDIKSIDENSYKTISILFQSIISGKLLSFRQMMNHELLRGMKEVRMSDCRIAFLMDNGYCIILSAFVKKRFIDTVIYNNIAQRIAIFNRNKQEVFDQYDEEKIGAEIGEIFQYLEDYKMGAK